MFYESEPDRKMRLFLQRGVEIANLGFKQMSPEFQTDSPYFYQDFSVVIAGQESGQEYRLIHENRRGQFTSGQTYWTTRERLVVAFNPKPQDNLRFIKGTEGELPILEVYIEDYKHHGILQFDPKHVERRSWWSRVKDSIKHIKQLQKLPEASLMTVDIVGKDRGADRVLDNLIMRLVATPTAITPIDPDKWGDIVRGQVR